MSLVSGSATQYIGADQILVDQIVYELKSQGIFDSFRKECIADVDTKPAYQNLRQRVEGSVSSFLKEQKWNPESNKNQLRELLRKNIYESGFLETGVERIVSQVVNPKINTVFLPKVKEIFYKYIGLQTPTTLEDHNLTDVKNIDVIPKTEVTIEAKVEIKEESKVEIELNTQDLLPTDLEAISPENDNIHEHDNTETNQDSNSVAMDDDDTSPPFEPIDEDLSFKLISMEENSIDSHLSGMSGLASHDSQHSIKDNTLAMQQLLESDSQISKNSSSDDRLSIVTDEASNTKVDMLVVTDGVVVAIDTSQLSENNEISNDNKVIEKDIVNENSPDTKDIAKENVTNDNLEDSKIKEETTDLEIKAEIFDEDSKTTQFQSSENSDNAIKQNVPDSTSKHSTSHKKSTSKDYKSSSKHSSSSSKSKDKSRDSKDYRESKEKSSNSKGSSSSRDKDKDYKSKSSSSTSSNRHSSDKDKDRSASTKKYSSSSHRDKDKSSSNTKNKSSVSSNDKDKIKDKESSIISDKEKECSASSKHKESSSRDHSSSKSSTSSSRDKSSSKDHSKSSKSKNSSSSNKHRSSSSRKDSTSSSTRNDNAKSHSSSSSSKDKRDKKDSSAKDDHFASKSHRTERRSTDRDSNDGQAKNKRGTTSNDSTLLAKSDEQTSNNNTTEDSSSSNCNSKDGSNSDCCQTGEGTNTVPDKPEDKKTEVADNVQQVVALSLMTDLDMSIEGKLDQNSEDLDEKDNATNSLLSSITQSDTPTLVESTVSDVVETLDAIKSHLAEYKLEGHNDDILPKIRLPKLASNFREARKIMKLRKQLKQQNKLRKLLSKEISTAGEYAEQPSIGEVVNGDISDDIDNNGMTKCKENESYSKENSVLLLEQNLCNDSIITSPTKDIKIEHAVKAEPTKTNFNDDCLYLDNVTETTMRYLNYMPGCIEKMEKEIRALEVKKSTAITKRKSQKRKFSTLSSDSSIYNDSTADQASSSSKVSRNISPPLALQTSAESNSTAASKNDVVPASVEPPAAVTSATAHVRVVKQRRIYNNKATQRYNSDDLYKPRPFLKGTTKRTSGRVMN